MHTSHNDRQIANRNHKVTNTHTHTSHHTYACMHTRPEGEREGEGFVTAQGAVCPDLTGRATTRTTASTLADMIRCAVQQLISSHQSEIRCRHNAESRLTIRQLQFDSTEMHEIHTNRTRTTQNRMAHGISTATTRVRQRRHNQTSELARASLLVSVGP